MRGRCVSSEVSWRGASLPRDASRARCSTAWDTGGAARRVAVPSSSVAPICCGDARAATAVGGTAGRTRIASLGCASSAGRGLLDREGGLDVGAARAHDDVLACRRRNARRPPASEAAAPRGTGRRARCSRATPRRSARRARGRGRCPRGARVSRTTRSTLTSVGTGSEARSSSASRSAAASSSSASVRARSARSSRSSSARAVASSSSHELGRTRSTPYSPTSLHGALTRREARSKASRRTAAPVRSSGSRSRMVR